jgi:hypothetical protein
MSFHDKGFWIAKSGETDEETFFVNSSRIKQPKRSHQWYSDSSEPELFPSKKQSIQSPNSKLLSWENGSTQFVDRLFEPEPAVGTTFNTKKIPFQPDSSFGLSMSYTINNPLFKKVNKVKESENEIQPLREDEISMSIGTTSFGGFQEKHAVIDTYTRPVTSFDLLYSHPTIQSLDSSCDDVIISAPLTKTGAMLPPKIKSEPKLSRKEAPNSFPSNVRSLIATGMLDGVPIKYISITREELCGIIKGSGYLCGCQSCNYAKALNAYEFERHAGCKTKHPNNHIYFENGKTIYQIVQELRTTPQSLLFDAIQTVTGSSINQKAFRIWKESFQAATRELQRIYGKDELNL